MKHALGESGRFDIVKGPLSNEAEVQAVLASTKATKSDVWNALRFLAASARCTLQAGHGVLAQPLILACFERAPDPFHRLAALRQLVVDDDRDQKQWLQGITEDDAFGASEKGVAHFISTALVVWHSVLLSTKDGECARGFIRFSHCTAHVLTRLAGVNGVVPEDLIVCWLYNILMFAHKHKCMQVVGCYLVEGLQDEPAELPEDFRDATTLQSLPFSFRKWGSVRGFFRVGVRSQPVVSMLKRLCLELYADGCAVLCTAQGETDHKASTVASILRRAFGNETSQYMVDFRRPLRIDAQCAALLCENAISENQLCVPREKFWHIRMACSLRAIACKAGCSAIDGCKFVSISSVVALALRHHYIDIAAEILQACGGMMDPSDESLLIWGEGLEAVLSQGLSPDRRVVVECAVGSGKQIVGNVDGGAADNMASVQTPKPAQFLHEVAQRSFCGVRALRILALSRDLTELLPVGLILLRGRGTLRHRLLTDKIAVPFIVAALSRLVALLVHEGDMPLARCFLPLVAHLCVAVPSRAHLLFLLQTIAAFAKELPNDIEEWAPMTSTFCQFLPLQASDGAPPYRETKASTVGRTFASRRRIFDALGTCKQQPDIAMHRYCQVEVSLLGEGKGVRLIRTTHFRATVDTRWEKVLPIEQLLLQLVEEMKNVERRNRDHLSSTERGNSPVCGDGLATSSQADDSVCSTYGSVRLTNDGEWTKKAWWEQRRALDKAIGAVVQSMQSAEGFGCWRIAMCGDPPDSFHCVARNAAGELMRALDLPAQQEGDILLIFSALPYVGGYCPREADLLFNPSHIAPVGSCSSCDEVLCTLAVALEGELTTLMGRAACGGLEACRRACLQVLTAMYTMALDQQYYRLSQDEEESGYRLPHERGHVNLFEVPRAPVYLVLDNEIHCLPFEGIDVLRHGSVSRVPTASFVSSFLSAFGKRGDVRYSNCETFKKGENMANSTATVCCVIDPAGIMPGTSGRLLPLCTQRGWRVKSHSSPPTTHLIREMYEAGVRLYVYAGHGKGEQIIHRGELYERVPDPTNFPSVFLMGCSSAYMDGGLTYDCYGMPYAFLHAGAPVFVGCLWHVTDGEIDRLTRRLLSLVSYGKQGAGEAGAFHPIAVGEALRLARMSCRLPYLTGCATVLYGVNIPLGVVAMDGAV